MIQSAWVVCETGLKKLLKGGVVKNGMGWNLIERVKMERGKEDGIKQALDCFVNSSSIEIGRSYRGHLWCQR